MGRTASRKPPAPSGAFGPEILVDPPGPRAKAIIDRDARFITPSYTRSYPLVIDRGEGQFLWDPDGNRFLDFTAGVAVNAVGHAHPEVVAAVAAQAGRFMHMAGTDFYYDVMARFAEKLASLAPGREPKQCFLTNSGTESNEAAIKLARYVTRRPRLIAFYNSFHGRTLGALSLTASKPAQRRHFAPLLDVTHAIFNDLEFLTKWVFRKTCPPEDVAAIFVEPVQGEGGYNVATRDFLQGLRKVCDEHGILLVADEVQTWLGRTGKINAMDHFGVVPDILTVAKPVGGGLPIGAMIARKDLHVWPSGAHANTFGGNPVACAAGLKTIEIIERDGLVESAAELGTYLSVKLKALVAKHDFLYEERGLGLLRAIEVVKSKATREPDPARRDRIVEQCFRRGLLLLGCGETAIRFLPALTVEKGHIDAATESLAAALRAC